MKVSFNVPSILFLYCGTVFLLFGFEVFKGKWKNEETRKKKKRMFKIVGIMQIVWGTILLLEIC